MQKEDEEEINGNFGKTGENRNGRIEEKVERKAGCWAGESGFCLQVIFELLFFFRKNQKEEGRCFSLIFLPKEKLILRKLYLIMIRKKLSKAHKFIIKFVYNKLKLLYDESQFK